MKLAVLGSGSRGNAVIISEAGAALLVDAGFGPRTLARRAAAAGIAFQPLAGIVLTHEHGDHARGAVRVARRLNCPIAASSGTLDGLPRAHEAGTLIPLEAHRPQRLGPFTVTTCHTSHDAAEPVALVVSGPAGARVGIAYDLGRPTAAVRYLLRGCTALVLEANHDDVMLRTGPYPASVRRRIAGSGGHLSNRAAAALAAELTHEGLTAVILAHLSERCNRAELARAAVAAALAPRGFAGKIFVADQDDPLPAIPLPGLPLAG